MHDDSQQPAAEPVEIPLPSWLRPLLPHTMLKGWLMPLAFAVLAAVFWGYGSGQLDPTPQRHLFMAWCFAAVTVFFALARLWVGWRVVRRRDGR